MILTANRNIAPVTMPHNFFLESDGNAYINEIRRAIKWIAEHSEITFTLNPPALIKAPSTLAVGKKSSRASPERKAVSLFKGAYHSSGKRLSATMLKSMADMNFIVKTEIVFLSVCFFQPALLKDYDSLFYF
jgi:hypothetical protein